MPRIIIIRIEMYVFLSKNNTVLSQDRDFFWCSYAVAVCVYNDNDTNTTCVIIEDWISIEVSIVIPWRIELRFFPHSCRKWASLPHPNDIGGARCLHLHIERHVFSASAVKTWRNNIPHRHNKYMKCSILIFNKIFEYKIFEIEFDFEFNFLL